MRCGWFQATVTSCKNDSSGVWICTWLRACAEDDWTSRIQSSLFPSCPARASFGRSLRSQALYTATQTVHAPAVLLVTPRAIGSSLVQKMVACVSGTLRLDAVRRLGTFTSDLRQPTVRLSSALNGARTKRTRSLLQRRESRDPYFTLCNTSCFPTHLLITQLFGWFRSAGKVTVIAPPQCSATSSPSPSFTYASAAFQNPAAEDPSKAKVPVKWVRPSEAERRTGTCVHVHITGTPKQVCWHSKGDYLATVASDGECLVPADNVP